MKKLNFDFTITGLKGEVMDFNVKESVANLLLSATSGSPIRMRSLAFDIYKNGTIEVDQVDYDEIKAIVSDFSSKVSVVIGAALMECFENK